MRSKTLLLIAAIVGAVLFLPRLIRAMQPSASALPAQPPNPAPTVGTTEKKTIFGKIVNGITQIGGSVGGQYGNATASIGGALSQFTK